MQRQRRLPRDMCLFSGCGVGDVEQEDYQKDEEEEKAEEFEKMDVMSFLTKVRDKLKKKNNNQQNLRYCYFLEISMAMLSGHLSIYRTSDIYQIYTCLGTSIGHLVFCIVIYSFLGVSGVPGGCSTGYYSSWGPLLGWLLTCGKPVVVLGLYSSRLSLGRDPLGENPKVSHIPSNGVGNFVLKTSSCTAE